MTWGAIRLGALDVDSVVTMRRRLPRTRLTIRAGREGRMPNTTRCRLMFGRPGSTLCAIDRPHLLEHHMGSGSRPRRSGNMERRWLVRIVTALMGAVALPQLAHAVVNIRNEGWLGSYTIRRDTSAPVDSGTAFRVNFDADVTSLDLAPGGGVRFSIVERDAGDSDRLFDFTIPCADLPPVGEQIHIEVDFFVRCDVDGRLLPIGLGFLEMAWCSPLGSRACRPTGPGLATMPGSSDPESFEFALLDENGVVNPNPTREDVADCNPLVPGTLVSRLPEALPRKTLAAPPGTIGVYFDAAGTQCSRSVTPFGVFDLYVIAKTSGITDCGFTGAEFRILGLPSGWYASVAEAPAVVYFGEPFAGGVNVAFPTCQQSGNVLFYRFSVLPTTAASDLVLQVTGRNPPLNPSFPWPLLTLCNVPGYTKTRVDGLAAYVNPTHAPICDATVSVQPTTWSRMKQLFAR